MADKFQKLMAKYRENEDNNYHSENLLLLAKAVGSKNDIEMANTVLKALKKDGYAKPEFTKKRNALNKKLWPMFKKEVEKEKKESEKKTVKESADIVADSMDNLFGNNYTLGTNKFITESVDAAKLNEKKLDNIEVLLDSNRGIYIPKAFVNNFDMEEWGISEDLAEECKDPENENYWEAWDEILDKAEYTAEDGRVFTLYQDGDLFAICRDALTDEEKENFGFNEDVETNHSDNSAGEDNDKHWYSSSSGKIEFPMTLEQAESVSQPGKDAEEDVRELMKDPSMKEVIEYLKNNMDAVKEELGEQGAWDEEELEDEDMNIVRLLWIAGNRISEEAFMKSGDDEELEEDVDTENDDETEGTINEASRGNLLDQEVMDSRDIIKRINELERVDESDLDDSEKEELQQLKEFEDEGIPDWEDGATLISDGYWIDYVKDLLDDTGDIPKDLPWYIVIDWERTANNISQDYGTVSVNGEDWHYRA